MTLDSVEYSLPVRPSVVLVGQDGNAFNLTATCARALRDEMNQSGKYSVKEVNRVISEFHGKCFYIGSYNDLLQFLVTHFDVS